MVMNSLCRIWNAVEKKVQVVHNTSRKFNEVDSSCENEDGGTPDLNSTMAFNPADSLMCSKKFVGRSNTVSRLR
jgi:hypothetical protein